ncbi:hypothetical protein, conserved in T. vivax [Trypanosoma vivax Y486]|uniref:Uncharacterized protein n=1 Tax=Trypanosoma vivax (strain Y486) TaxID=1055687 RepID=F9WRI0_TRYVY|nr:hypothetical protein, conserved in T. vivax [Trypanosoma vivax Y486]|eukprot:CCD20164.1 hypothetical protein, conserved in T. vivax [Trypanosoma vivax Y486]
MQQQEARRTQSLQQQLTTHHKNGNAPANRKENKQAQKDTDDASNTPTRHEKMRGGGGNAHPRTQEAQTTPHGAAPHGAAPQRTQRAHARQSTKRPGNAEENGGHSAHRLEKDKLRQEHWTTTATRAQENAHTRHTANKPAHARGANREDNAQWQHAPHKARRSRARPPHKEDAKRSTAHGRAHSKTLRARTVRRDTPPHKSTEKNAIGKNTTRLAKKRQSAHSINTKDPHPLRRALDKQSSSTKHSRGKEHR